LLLAGDAVKFHTISDIRGALTAVLDQAAG